MLSDTICIENNGEITVLSITVAYRLKRFYLAMLKLKILPHQSEKVTILKDKLKQDAIIPNESVNNASLL